MFTLQVMGLVLINLLAATIVGTVMQVGRKSWGLTGTFPLWVSDLKAESHLHPHLLARLQSCTILLHTASHFKCTVAMLQCWGCSLLPRYKQKCHPSPHPLPTHPPTTTHPFSHSIKCRRLGRHCHHLIARCRRSCSGLAIAQVLGDADIKLLLARARMIDELEATIPV
jgi:hypothetical protein